MRENFTELVQSYFDEQNYAVNDFVYNDSEEQRKVSTEIIKNLETCDEFYFSVAFITESGLVQLKQAIKEALKRGVKGKILTTNYLTFSEPKALSDLLKLPNVETRMYYLTKEDQIGFHTKGYIFKKGDKYNVIIGSSNITSKALNINKEWNSLISGTPENKAIINVLKEFNSMFEKGTPLKDVIDNYKAEYDSKLIVKTENNVNKYIKLTPNEMQRQFIFNINELIKQNQKRGLLISATGTGKTFASAFAVKEIESFKVNRLLFIAHRETILKQSLNTFNLVFNDSNVKTALFTGNNKDIEGANFIFASYSLIQKREYLTKFKPDEFDMIIIDEVHRVGENHYQDIINYFKPKFLLGMSATPDRTDNYDIYSLFDHNIIYEIRLMDALNLNLLTPFNYFGISDLEINGVKIDDYSDFNLLTSDERVKHIIEESEYYGFSGNRIKGLIFVNKIDVGEEIANKLNKFGKKTLFLSGSDSPEKRENAIKRLEEDKYTENSLDYIITVDIFNEGVDIPSVNQIILLRPTKSSIIFIQQIGRGLRKFKNKEFLVILDFIGNYKENFNIVKAFNKYKWNKGNATKTVNEVLPGLSSISFDKISKELIFKSIDNAKINTKKEIYSNYLDVKNRLNHIPTLLELDKFSTTPVNVFLDDQIYRSYYDLLLEKEEIDSKLEYLNLKERALLSYFSKYVFDGKRKCDIELVEHLCFNGTYKLKNPLSKNDFMYKIYEEFISMSSFTNKNKWTFARFSEENDEIIANSELLEIMKNPVFVKYLKDGLEYAKYSNKMNYKDSDYFVLNEKYTRVDVSRIANLSRNDVNTIYGYRIKKAQGITPIFINYSKQENDIKYQDHFISPSVINWSSRSNLTLDSNEIKTLIECSKNDTAKLQLFIQKSNLKMIKDDGYYYLGEATILDAQNFIDPETNKKLVHFKLLLQNPVRYDIYEYLTTCSDDTIKF